MHPANKIPNLKRRVDRARNFGVTCPASRHLHQVAETMLRNRTQLWPMIDAEHVAGSMLSVLESLWKARAELARLKGGNQ